MAQNQMRFGDMIRAAFQYDMERVCTPQVMERFMTKLWRAIQAEPYRDAGAPDNDSPTDGVEK